MNNKVYLGSDHGGYEVKELVKRILESHHIEYEDLGAYSQEISDDYPNYAEPVARRVAEEGARGILVCGSGTGMVIAANKVDGVRASVAYDEYSAETSRTDNDANILALRGRNFAHEHIPAIVEKWLFTPFSNEERHNRRIEQIREIERRS